MQFIAVNCRNVLKFAVVAALSFASAGCVTTQVSRTGPDPIYHRTDVEYVTRERPGTIVVDPEHHFLYLVQPNERAIRYGVGVGAEGYGWSGVAKIHSKQEWPDWYPTKEYLASHPKVIPAMQELPSGQGMRGGPENPMGARAMYLWQGSKDTLFRIHGTNEPWTIGTDVSAGCIRLTNEDVSDLYAHVAVGAKVIVLPSRGLTPTVSRASGSQGA
jgi:lipoprotein-anchoring transpeptidase ErfK/SrfK